MLTFMELVRLIDEGKLETQLDETLAQVARAAAKTGTPGEVTLKLTITPDFTEALVTPKVTAKTPMAKRHAAILPLSAEGELIRPVQQVLFHESRSSMS